MENRASSNPTENLDQVSAACLTHVVRQSEIQANRFEGIKFVVVVMSAKGMVFDLGALRQKVMLAYPEAGVFFLNTMGKPIGAAAPEKVDLMIDFTGPGQRQGLFVARKFRRLARFVIGRNAGLFRKKIYNRIFDEKENAASLPSEQLQRERFVQKKVLNLAGVDMVQSGETPPDRGKSIALELPGMQRL
jgi:hypothetical protein